MRAWYFERRKDSRGPTLDLDRGIFEVDLIKETVLQLAHNLDIIISWVSLGCSRLFMAPNPKVLMYIVVQ